jgi:hypothetical protein
MVIRKHVGNMFDVFLADEGWGGWVRVRRSFNGIQPVSGVRVSRAILKQIEEALK